MNIYGVKTAQSRGFFLACMKVQTTLFLTWDREWIGIIFFKFAFIRMKAGVDSMVSQQV
jgi:hypothetical protein